MYRIIDGRGTGKTSRLLLIAKEHNAIVVCAHPNAMRAKAEYYGIVGLDYISWSEFLTQGCNEDRAYVIDEMEIMLKSKFPKVIGYTMSNED